MRPQSLHGPLARGARRVAVDAVGDGGRPAPTINGPTTPHFLFAGVEAAGASSSGSPAAAMSRGGANIARTDLPPEAGFVSVCCYPESASCSVVPFGAVRRNLIGGTLNPKVGGSSPPRHTRQAPLSGVCSFRGARPLRTHLPNTSRERRTRCTSGSGPGSGLTRAPPRNRPPA
jgi:hypothetical protein